jgi:hypothetical protein
MLSPFTDFLAEHYGHAEFVRKQLERFTYKEGWTFDVIKHALTGHALRVTFRCKDTYNPHGPTIDIGNMTSLLFIPDDPDEFARWLGGHLRMMEAHESREWLRRDGKIFDDPHAATVSVADAARTP